MSSSPRMHLRYLDFYDFDVYNFKRDSSYYVNVDTEIFMDMCGKSYMSDGLVEILPSAPVEIFTGKKPHILEMKQPLPQ